MKRTIAAESGAFFPPASGAPAPGSLSVPAAPGAHLVVIEAYLALAFSNASSTRCRLEAARTSSSSGVCLGAFDTNSHRSSLASASIARSVSCFGFPWRRVWTRIASATCGWPLPDRW